jgi:hypothetical protein
MDIIVVLLPLKKAIIQQALEESGIGTIQEIKHFYVNDILTYYRQTYRKVSKMYAEYKARKQAEKNEIKNNEANFAYSIVHSSNRNENDFIINEQEFQIEQFMSENDLYNQFFFIFFEKFMKINQYLIEA